MRTTGTGESAILLLDVVETLAKEGIAYAVVGAIAASIHGAIRASMDADVVLSLPVQKARDLEAKFQAAGFQTELSRGDFDDPIPGLLKVSDNHGNRVDLLIGLRGMETEAFSRALDVAFEGEKLRFIGLEDFVAMKAFAGGPVDMVDASRAIAAAGDALDRDLLRRLAGRYGKDAAGAVEALLSDSC